MRIFRGFLAAAAIAVGVVCAVTWLVVSLMVHAIESPSTLTNAALNSFDNPIIRNALIGDTQETIRNTLAFEGEAGQVADTAIDGAVATAIASDAFRTALQTQMEGAHEQFLRELQDPGREPAPLIITVDPSAVVNDQLATVGAGDTVDTIVYPPVEMQVSSADGFDAARATYSVLQGVNRWAPWVALISVALGLVVAPRRLWYLAWLGYVAGIATLIAALVMWIAAKGSQDVELGKVATPLLWWSLAALGAAIVLTVVARMHGRTRVLTQSHTPAAAPASVATAQNPMPHTTYQD